MAPRLLVLHGPNLALLAQAAGTSLPALEAALRARAAALGGVRLHVVSSNSEGALLDALHAEAARVDGVLVSPGALALGGYALAEGLKLAGLPAVEVHPGPLPGRKSLLRPVCLAQFAGKGVDSYLAALERLVAEAGAGLRRPAAGAGPQKAPGPKAQPGKTLGRKPAARAPRPPASRPGAAGSGKGALKTLGRAVHIAGEDEAAGLLSRALVRQRIAERLAGTLSPAGLATWARTHWLEVQRGAPAESGQREVLEDTLQRLTLSTLPASRLTDEQLIELMTELDT